MVRNLYSLKMENVLKAQIDVVDSIYALQKQIHADVMARNWSATQEKMNTLSDLSVKFSNYDKEAGKIIAEMFGERVTYCDFHRFSNELPVPEKAKLDNLYKSLRDKVFLSRVENDVFNAYVKHARDLVEGVFNIVADDRQSQSYTRTGQKAYSDMSNLVVDRFF